ncbi:MAG: tRNA (adenosine(37)-N6)-dimethylallyltransferase MiaA [Deltaproteobacteria bacterium]|nr:tRNA (adenosine(37)-N6)-dimethylallyltransferase MiaA [Deltaproteobacteria bacterium]
MPDAAVARILAVVGPTASGKSDVALTLAKERGGELISCDSVQVYRGFEIGCAKPSATQRREVPHHLIDVATWSEGFDAMRFRTLAEDALADIRRRGRRPILVGGTGLYLRALRFGIADAPRADAELRQRLMAEEHASPGTLYARLRELDPPTAAVTDRNNLVRVVRALEIQALSGVPASTLRAGHGFAREQVPLRIVALTWPDHVLKERIRARSEQMLELGLIAEVEALLKSGVAPACRPMTSVGYRETCAVVRDQAPVAGLAARIAARTWAYARRQRTWLRKEAGVEWWSVTDLEVTAGELLRSLGTS